MSTTRAGELTIAVNRQKEMLGRDCSSTSFRRGSFSPKFTEIVSGPKIIAFVDECRSMPCSICSKMSRRMDGWMDVK